MQTLRLYIAWARHSFTPLLGEEAEEVLCAYYTMLRQQGGRIGAAGQVGVHVHGARHRKLCPELCVAVTSA